MKFCNVSLLLWIFILTLSDFKGRLLLGGEADLSAPTATDSWGSRTCRVRPNPPERDGSTPPVAKGFAAHF